MNFGLDKATNQRIEPRHGLHANCPCCGTDLVAKCGDIRVHHWAHKTGRTCDSWWEPETEWHRNWKNRFPKDWREVIKFDKENGEKHIADIYNPNVDLVIEFQNSPIDIRELESRERFYKRMIWIVNAREFDFSTLSLDEKNADVEKLEKKFRRDAYIHPTALFKPYGNYNEYKIRLRQITKAIANGKMKIEEGNDRKSQIDTDMAKNMTGLHAREEDQEVMSLWKYHKELWNYKIENQTKEIDAFFIQYTWRPRRKVWDKAKLPVFFDLGNEVVWIKSQFIAKRVPFEKFFKKYGPQIGDSAKQSIS